MIFQLFNIYGSITSGMGIIKQAFLGAEHR